MRKELLAMAGSVRKLKPLSTYSASGHTLCDVTQAARSTSLDEETDAGDTIRLCSRMQVGCAGISQDMKQSWASESIATTSGCNFKEAIDDGLNTKCCSKHWEAGGSAIDGSF